LSPAVRVLVVTSTPPLAEGAPGGRCALGLLRGLVEHGVAVQALSPRRPFDPPGAVAPDLALEEVELGSPDRGFGARQVERLRRPMGELTAPSFVDRIRDLAASADIVHLEEVEAAATGTASAPTVAHLHYRARLDTAVAPLWRAGARAAAERALAERRAIRRHRYLLANSPKVADTLRRDGSHAEVLVVPLTLDPSLYVLAEHAGPPVAGIIGTATWPPTAAAIERLVARVWPLVRRACPDARLRIAGRGTETLDVEGEAGVEVVGPVESSAAFLRELSCLIYPAPRGSGMKVKVLESLASGVPVLTTVHGAEGLPPSPAVVVSERDDELAAATATLLRDPVARREVGAEARGLFDARFAPGPATEPLLDLYQRMSSVT
jgi:glycosyltransferase involved in cell wall biosynthesis